jgi:hypothetical protein
MTLIGYDGEILFRGDKEGCEWTRRNKIDTAALHRLSLVSRFYDQLRAARVMRAAGDRGRAALHLRTANDELIPALRRVRAKLRYYRTVEFRP